jgi:4-hydroxybenzoyl-CoA thioesterase
MLKLVRNVSIEWGDCDPAGIVFYPRYFAMCDASTTKLLEYALGMKKINIFKQYDFGGFPVAQTQVKFLTPGYYGDETVIETQAVEVKRSSVSIEHKIRRGDTLLVEGFEIRVWVMQDPDDPTKLRSRELPELLARRLREG